MTCEYTGCNVPEGECSGACLNKEIVVSEKIETLESITERLIEMHKAVAVLEPNYTNFARLLLQDLAILAHIPAVKGLREENARLEAVSGSFGGQLAKAQNCIASLEAEVERLVKLDIQRCREYDQRIASLEQQLAEGGEAV